MAILAAVDFTREHLGVELKKTVPVCPYSARNNQCIGKDCPFSAVGHRKSTVSLHGSRRSQIAGGGLDKKLGNDTFEIDSAGPAPGFRPAP